MVLQFDRYNGKREECVTARSIDGQTGSKRFLYFDIFFYKGMQLVSSDLVAKVWSALGVAHAK